MGLIRDSEYERWLAARRRELMAEEMAAEDRADEEAREASLKRARALFEKLRQGG